MARPAARWLNQPSAIWERPALCTHRKSTAGTLLAEWSLEWARASSRWRAYFSAVTTSHLVTVALLAMLVVALEHEGLDGLEVEDAVELGMELLDHVIELHPLLRCHELVFRHVPPLSLLLPPRSGCR